MLVLWSGGCDSTLLLYRLCKDYATNGQSIRTISITHPQILAAEESKKARQEILKHLRKEFWISHLEISINHHGTHEAFTGGNRQPIVWLSMAIPYLATNEDLYAGYIQKDDVWHFKHEVITMFENMQKLLDNTGKIKFPLEWEDKSDVIKELKKVELYNLVWWCENPNRHRACGSCNSCKTHKKALR